MRWMEALTIDLWILHTSKHVLKYHDLIAPNGNKQPDHLSNPTKRKHEITCPDHLPQERIDHTPEPEKSVESSHIICIRKRNLNSSADRYTEPQTSMPHYLIGTGE